MKQEQNLRVAIISAGRMASTIDDEIQSSGMWPSLKKQLPYSHAPCYRSFPDVEIAAVCDVDEEKSKAFCERWGVSKSYTDYREMIDREKPDIVSVATAAHLHAEMALYAMEHGVRGIYCEKAMCCSLSEADAMVNSVKLHGVKFMLGAQRRHHPHFQKVKQIVESGEIGQLISVTSWFAASLLHSLSHMVDGSLYFAGDSPAVWAAGVLGRVRSLDELESRRITQIPAYDERTNRWSGDPACVSYTAFLENGVYLFHLPSVTDVRWEITCSNGYIQILNNNDFIRLWKRQNLSYNYEEVALPEIAPASSHRGLVKDLISCVRNGGKPLANETAARNGMEILLGAAESDRKDGIKVMLPLQNREMYVPSH